MKQKTFTELALDKQREAWYERRNKPGAPLAPMFERKAAELLSLDKPPDVGPGGEVVRAQMAGLPQKRVAIQETLAEGATRIAEDASIQRADLLMQPSFNSVAMGVDAAESIQASNSLEKMLAHQMAVAHEAALRMMDRGLSYEHRNGGDQVEACRCVNAAARLMGAFNDALLTLHRLRMGGNQTVTVQHVNLAPGAQALIGDVGTGGRKPRGNNARNG